MGERLFEKTLSSLPLYYFETISRIPRNSGDEKRISDFLLRWALDLGLEAHQDEQYNLIIHKKAYPGREAEPPLILQAHLDMVCEKRGDSAHDFTKDGIPLQREGDLLMSAAGTTLGADDGIGVAYCMAVLASQELSHPPIEVILTTEEESTFRGAENVSFDGLYGTRLINLDHATEDTVLCGSCGGTGIEVQIPLQLAAGTNAAKSGTDAEPAGTDADQNGANDRAAARFALYELSVSGLRGGHSGEDIHRGNGSAIQLMTRLLRRLRKQLGEEALRLVRLRGGTSRLAISREAKAQVLVAREGEGKLLAAAAEMERAFAREYAAAAPGLRVCVTERERFAPGAQTGAIEAAAVGREGCPPACYTGEAFGRILDALTLFPDGIMQMNGAFSGMVESSLNLGIVSAEGPLLTLTAEIRGAYQSTVEDIRDKVERLAACLGGSCRTFSAYYPWEYRRDSALRETAVSLYRELFGQELKETVVHAGIECSFFLQARPELDAIALGPNCWQFHSPEERMSISSALKMWEFLQKLLERC